ncbi:MULTISPECIES: hypothetical protein [unclassified Mycobacterium]|uniref:hypothetical protein n=1 Tax=unclassified Mycobacterium TaxID=2642494 RepID=UPI0029C90750|nr:MULTISPECIES: hypothetical protein [unclassified Mycobacterium]
MNARVQANFIASVEVPRSPWADGVDGHQLDVIGSSLSDVVFTVGGWLCDRAMSGWRVNVSISDDFDDLPLRILGVKALPFEPALEFMRSKPPAAALAICSDVLANHTRLRETVAIAAKRGLPEVIVWGGGGTTELADRLSFSAVEHRISAAARAFKAHALVAAANHRESVAPIEKFCSTNRTSH